MNIIFFSSEALICFRINHSVFFELPVMACKIILSINNRCDPFNCCSSYPGSLRID